MSTVALRDDLARLVEPIAQAAGLDLEDVEIKGAGRRRLVRIIVDKDHGVGPDELASVSAVISARLDDTDLMGSAPYVLEVSSPGVERPLTAPRHWRRARGRLVRGTMIEGGSLAGRVIESDETGVTLDVGGARRHVPYDQIAKARVEVEFNRRGAAERAEEV